MEPLNSMPHPHLAGNQFSGLPLPVTTRNGVARKSANFSDLPEISEEITDPLAGKVFVAVGKSIGRATGLLEWTFRQFQPREVTLLHVHRPSPTIPTLLGKLPASQANEELVAAYRREEREQARKLLCQYLGICHRAKVHASVILIESGQVQKGIIELVVKLGIKKLVMGATTDNCMKVKTSSNKANYTAKSAPPFCEIWFVCKGKHVWTREASGDPESLPPSLHLGESSNAEELKSKSLQDRKRAPEIDPISLRFSSFYSGRLSRDRNRVLGDLNLGELDISAAESRLEFVKEIREKVDAPKSQPLASLIGFSASGFHSSCESAGLPDLKSKEEQKELVAARAEAGKSKKEALAEPVKCKQLESEALEAINRARVCETAHAREVQLTEEIEEALRVTKLEQEKLAKQRDEAMRELQTTMKALAILDGQAGENSHQRQEATGKLKLIQASISTLRHEKRKIRRQRDEALQWLESERSCPEEAQASDSSELFNHSPKFADYSLLDLQTATCNFSESFMIGRGGYGCVYKGEMLRRTVAIKKLHPENMQGRSEFEREVQVLSKLRHPNLVTLIGACAEDWSLVYEYLPNGSLEDRLFCKTNSSLPLNWKTRVKIAAEISSALLFLHSSKPVKIVHGDLKPENILLDSDFNSKISDFGLCRLVPEETTSYRVFRRNTEPKGAFLYTDPEFQMTGNLTPKSDVYAFGIIILQLLTGRLPLGVVREVRQAVASGKLAVVLDRSAGEWPNFLARRLAELGLSFAEMNARDRLELTAGVVRELKRLCEAEERVVPPFFLCPILQEIMHDPQLAADGFTYEGRPCRGGCKTGEKPPP